MFDFYDMPNDAKVPGSGLRILGVCPFMLWHAVPVSVCRCRRPSRCWCSTIGRSVSPVESGGVWWSLASMFC